MRRVKEALLTYVDYAISIPALLWQVLFLWLPFLIVISASVYTRRSGFSLNSYAAILTSAHAYVVMRSLLLALINTWCCLLVAYPVAYFIAFVSQRWKRILVFLLTLPFWVNFLVHVYAWFFLLERNGLLNNILLSLHIIDTPLHLMNSLFAVWLVMFQVYLPFMILPLYVVFEKFDYRLIEASMDLGATRGQTFWHVTFPLTLAGAKLGFFLVLGMSFGDYVIPQLLNGGKTLFVGTLISDYFIINRTFSTGAAFTCLSAVVLIGLMGVCFAAFKALAKGVK